MADDVVELAAPWRPDPGAPIPALFQTENGPARLLYYPGPLAPTDKRFALVRFPTCLISKFGYPGDEALEGHPLYDKGLDNMGYSKSLNRRGSTILLSRTG